MLDLVFIHRTTVCKTKANLSGCLEFVDLAYYIRKVALRMKRRKAQA